jgi:BirA family biotin operon repressor/biotin-[acetyl-CoA-carboxylase] ligase
MNLTVESIRSRLHARVVGKEIRCIDRCDSTNDVAWKEALAGAPDGTAVFAEEQTKGRGRFGRAWIAPRGKAVLCSVVLRPEIEAERVPLVTALAALAVADVGGDEATLRFPNDEVLEQLDAVLEKIRAAFRESEPGTALPSVAERGD